jgi:hypothetical protein
LLRSLRGRRPLCGLRGCRRPTNDRVVRLVLLPP